MSATELAQLKSAVVKLANDHWNSTGRSLLLSQVGQDLMRRGFDLKTALRGRRLVPFIREDLADEVTVITSPHDRLVKGLIPKSVAVTDAAALFAASPKTTQFDRRLWVSFSHPMDADSVRTVVFDPEIKYQDIPARSIKDAAGKYIIQPSLVIPPGTLPKEQRDEQVQKNIISWIQENGVDVERVRARHVPKPSHVNTDVHLLSDCLALLEAKDLERILIPLDLVQKLLISRSKS